MRREGGACDSGVCVRVRLLWLYAYGVAGRCQGALAPLAYLARVTPPRGECRNDGCFPLTFGCAWLPFMEQPAAAGLGRRCGRALAGTKDGTSELARAGDS